MRKIIAIVIICLFSVSCGIKNDPEYQAQNKYNEKIKVT